MSTESACIGVDPGLSGALALYWRGHVNTYDMPVFRIRGKKKLDLARLHSLLAELVAIHEPRVAVVEDVHSMPAQGVASSFTFGFVAGATQAVLAAHRIPVHLVSPAAWKRVMGLSSDKDASRALASRLLPGAAGQWCRKKDDGRAEAALLAFYGMRINLLDY